MLALSSHDSDFLCPKTRHHKNCNWVWFKDRRRVDMSDEEALEVRIEFRWRPAICSHKVSASPTRVTSSADLPFCPWSFALQRYCPLLLFWQTDLFYRNGQRQHLREIVEKTPSVSTYLVCDWSPPAVKQAVARCPPSMVSNLGPVPARVSREIVQRSKWRCHTVDRPRSHLDRTAMFERPGILTSVPESKVQARSHFDVGPCNGPTSKRAFWTESFKN